MKKYLATDLDGTLLNPKVKNQFVSKENADLIKKYFNKNIVIVSGRNPEFIKKVCKELEIKENFIACNGAIIYKDGNNIETSFLSNKLINELIEYTKKTFNKYRILLFANDSKIYSLSDDPIRVDNFEKNLLNEYPKLWYISNKDTNLIYSLLNKENTFVKINICLDPNEKKSLYNYLETKNYPINYSLCKSAVEITSFEVSKGLSLNKLISKMNIDSENVYVIGDDNNDSSMFEYFNNSFCINTNKNKATYTLSKFTDLEKYLKEE